MNSTCEVNLIKPKVSGRDGISQTFKRISNEVITVFDGREMVIARETHNPVTLRVEMSQLHFLRSRNVEAILMDIVSLNLKT